jgi:hypothetical protein
LYDVLSESKASGINGDDSDAAAVKIVVGTDSNLVCVPFWFSSYTLITKVTLQTVAGGRE